MKKNGDALTEFENLKELIEREKASVCIMLSAASCYDRIDEDHIVMAMRDFYDRAEKMDKSLKRLEKFVR